MSTRTSKHWICIILVLSVLGCGPQSAEILRDFVSPEFEFEISVPESLSSFGWLIVRPQDANLSHRYVPPDSSDFEPMAVVVPPGQSFPALAPFFVDVFPLKNSGMTAIQLGELRAEGEQNVTRRSLTIQGQPAEEVTSLTGARVVIETFLVRNGIGYVINSSGSSDTGPAGGEFIVDSVAYQLVVETFRFLE